MQHLEKKFAQVIEYLLDHYSAEEFFTIARWALLGGLTSLTLLWLHLLHQL